MTDSVFFQIKLQDPSPAGVKISKKNVCTVEIIPETEDDDQDQMAKLENMIRHFVGSKENVTWGGQFMDAILLQPSIDDEGLVTEITGGEAVFHFAAIGFKVLFATIPPPKYGNGWFAFVIALCYIGVVTAVVGEVANLFGCALGLPQAITAITFVALGTSLPDTFASKTAAQ